MANSPCLPKRLSGIYGRYCTAASLYVRLRTTIEKIDHQSNKRIRASANFHHDSHGASIGDSTNCQCCHQCQAIFSKGRGGWLLAKHFYCFFDNYNVCSMDYQNHASDKKPTVQARASGTGVNNCTS
ncbi:uncharacterized protein LOC125770066 isoform X2 [Anopheles funestus]|uniref:uncharacterized protein LOC125770066 isoform X2 n=1 Tax=Anopheles funestus TaxID=62324 RepID=UPI0020C733BA|nr:uncharacterized protein LOC125770066 isoform X2 [Anopheles funestus]